MQTFGAFIVSFLAASGMAAAVPTQATTASVKAVYNTNHVPHAPSAHLKTLKKYGVPVPDSLYAAAAARPLQKRQTGSSVTTPEGDGFDREYLTEVDIGTPAQKLPLDFDTGSSDLWVFSTETPKSQASGHILYDPSKSSSSSKISGATWSIQYGDGSASNGDVFTDKVSVGGFTVASQAVESAKNVSEQFVEDAGSSGLLGLAFDNLNTVRPKAQKTWFSNAKSSLQAPLFTANLKHQQDGTYNFGFIDESEYTGQISYVPVDSSQGWWGFTASGYSINGKSVSTSRIAGIADTGTTLLYLPSTIVKQYYAKVPSAQLDRGSGLYYFECSENLPSFGFGINGQTITISGELMNYAIAEDTGELCFGGLQLAQAGTPNIFGDIALKAALVVFDAGNNRLGWAQK